MKRTLLTDRYVGAIRAPQTGRELHGDSLVPGLAVSVTANDARTFVLYTRYPRTSAPARRALGRVGGITLAEAREKARAWLALIARGIDPKDQEESERAARAELRASTFGIVAEEYLRRVQGKKRKGAEVGRDVRNHLIPIWGERPISEIARPDVVRMVDSFVDRGSPYQARNVLGYARQIFGWAVERGTYGIANSPCETIRPTKLIGIKEVRERTLSDDEIAALWRATGGAAEAPQPHSRVRGARRQDDEKPIGYPIGPMIRMLMLTGQRRGEVSDALWPEFAHLDDPARTLWTIPAERYKSGTTHLVPIGPMATALLAGLPRLPKGSAVFSTTGEKPINGFSKAKEAVDRAMARELGREPEPWTLHDIRRTVRTRLAQLRIPEMVAEMVIGHGKRGLVRVYDKHSYLDERREALAEWEAKLMTIVEPPPSNVVPLRPAVPA